jgi:hypothetical protein
MLVPASASSQEPAPRGPAQGLFGPTRNETGARDRLTFTFEAAEGFETEVPEAFVSRLPQQAQANGWSTLFAASSDYARQRGAFDFAGTASSAMRYYHEGERFEVMSHAAGLGLAVKLPKQGNIRVDSTVAYAPSYLYQLFPLAAPPSLGESIPTNPDYRIAQTPSYSYRTMAALSFGSRLGTMVTIDGAFNRTDFEQQGGRLDLEFYDAGATVAHAFGRNGGVSAGYRHRAGQFGYDEFTREHRLAFGGYISTALSRSRRATFRLTLAPSMLELPPTFRNEITGEAGGRLYRINGDANLNYPFRLNWRLAATYRRGIEFLAVFGEPVVSDGARVELTGLLSRRLDLSVLAGYAKGASALSDSGDYETQTGEVGLRYAIKRSFAIYTQYFYYYYDVRDQGLLAPELPRSFDQHGARVGLMVFLEALRR